MIYTSYFAKASSLPSNILAISIAAKPPSSWKGPQYKALAPKYGFFQEWKKNHDNNFYIERFNEEVLSNLKAADVVKILKQIAGKKDICLCCYEKPEEFCHRHLVAKWLTESGYETEEYNFN